MREEAGNLLSNLLMFMNENGWMVLDLLDEKLVKINRRIHQYKGLGRKLKVVFLGSAFSPVHVGHIEVAKLVLSTGAYDEVWMTPCYFHLFNRYMHTYVNMDSTNLNKRRY